MVARKSIREHIKTKALANPYDSQWEEYFEKRQQEHARKISQRVPSTLWRKQKGKCPYCLRSLLEVETRDLYHKTPICKGGSNAMDNLVILHPTCHQQIHARQKAGLSYPDSLLHA
ncbi:MAG: HNH endonuclease signature motif containing protein [Myxococcota bacterium]